MRQRLPVDLSVVSPSRRGGGSGDTKEPLLLDSRQVARLLGISRTKAFQLMSTGVIPVVRIGRCARVPRIDLAEWITEQTIAPRQVG